MIKPIPTSCPDLLTDMFRNVNGIRNPFGYPPWNSTARTFPAMFDILAADIVVMQELKIQRKDLRDDMVLLDGWDAYFSLPKHKKGYSGVGIYTRNATCTPIRAEEGLLGVLPSANGVPYCSLPSDESIGGYPSEEQVEALGVDAAALDAEGRCVVLEFPAFVLFGVYSPANSNGLRDDFRNGFIRALDCRIRNLTKAGKRVVLVGDLNVSRDERDTAAAAEDCRKSGITHEDYISTPNRRIFNQLLIGGEVIGERDEGREEGVLWDTCRGFHPERAGMYTHWEQKINARPGNYGSRIDFVLVAEEMRSWVKEANIQEGLLGSDHCPVYAVFHDQVTINGEEKAILDVMSPPGTFVDGTRQHEWKITDAPTFSAKKLPEFDKRRSIKSMFLKKSESSMVDAVADNDKKTDAMPSALDSNQENAIPAPPSTVHGESQNFDHSFRPASPKRKLTMPTKEKSMKKQKTESNSLSSKGQQSLKGFFSAPNKVSKPDPVTASVNDKPTLSEDPETPLEGIPDATIAAPSTPEKPISEDSPPPSQNSISKSIAATEANQRHWSALFAKPRAPLCEGHGEACKSMQTKKKGSNQGRSFWMCARPLGPSGEKEKGTEWRCGTFIWCSEWKGG
jgi:AP endonuclease 2